MSDINPSQLHVTAWPAVPLLLPVTYRVKSRLTDSGVIVPCPLGRYGEDWEEEAVELDGETYLRLSAVDLDDPAAIFAFVSKYGILGGWDAHVTLMRDAPLAVAQLYHDRLDSDVERKKRSAALNEEDARTPHSEWPSDVLRFHYTETLEEFRFAARWLRDLLSAWRMFKDGTSAADANWVSPNQSDPAFLQTDGFALFLLAEALPRWFLRPFNPRLTFHWAPPLPAGPAYSNLPPRRGGIGIDPTRHPVAGELYNICALELFNHIVENADYLICGNENCRQKNFVHQQGKKKNWHRSNGVLYCSPSCAHAVAQREYRRRHRGRGRREPSAGRGS